VLGFHLRREAANPNVVQRLPIATASPPEYLAWRRDVTEDDAVEGHHGDQVPLPSGTTPDWLKSNEHCLVSHWDQSAITRRIPREGSTLMHSAPPLLAMDYVGPVIGAAVFVVVMSLVKEPSRHTLNAILVAGASGVYLSGGFGPWELLYPAIVTPVVYLGLRSYRFIGVAWLMHSCWDIVHHLWGNPIWPFMPTSSFGCMMFDAVIAFWFLAGAPSIVGLGSHQQGSATRNTREVGIINGR
jgi:hypothetical protein